MISQTELDKTLREIEAQNGTVLKFNDQSPATLTKDQLRVLLRMLDQYDNRVKELLYDEDE